MAGDLIRITGASGHMGYRAVINALDFGYSVPAADEAVKDVKSVLHIVSPVALESDDCERDLIALAVKGTTGILKPALKAHTVAGIVFTSSGMAIMPSSNLLMDESSAIFTGNDRNID